MTEQSFNQGKKNNIVGRKTTVESIESKFEKVKEHLNASIIPLKLMLSITKGKLSEGAWCKFVSSLQI